jgi:hypothetical protein
MLISMSKSFTQIWRAGSEGQETGAITAAPENARKKI